jgi:hypothetical protein
MPRKGKPAQVGARLTSQPCFYIFSLFRSVIDLEHKRHEEDVSAQQSPARQDSRVSRANEHEGRTTRAEAQARKRAQAANAGALLDVIRET